MMFVNEGTAFRRFAVLAWMLVWSGVPLGAAGAARKAGVDECHRHIERHRLDEMDATTFDISIANRDKIARRGQACARLLKQDPRDPVAWNYFGIALIDSTSPVRHDIGRRAIFAYKQAIVFDQTYGEAWLDLAEAYVLTGQAAQAKGVLDSYILHHPKQAVPWSVLGAVNNAAGDFDAELVAYQRAIELDPKFAKAWRALGFAYIANFGKPKKGIPPLERAVQIDPSYLGAWIDLERAYSMAGRKADAERVKKRIDALKPAPH